MARSAGPKLLERGGASWVLNADDLEQAWEALHAALSWLAQAGVPVDMQAARIVLTELIGNAVRHAGGIGEVRIEVRPAYALLHVSDRGAGCTAKPALPDDPLSEGGRGLHLANAFASELRLLEREGGGTHAVARLPNVG